MIPKSGGDYAYISEAFGPLAGFLYLWMALIVIMPAGNAIIALTFANYILQPFWPECDPPTGAIRLLAALVICKFPLRHVFLDLNCFDVILYPCLYLLKSRYHSLKKLFYFLLQKPVTKTCHKNMSQKPVTKTCHSKTCHNR